MEKIYEFDPVIYPRKLWVIVTDKDNELEELFDMECDITGFANKNEAIVFPCSLKENGKKGVAVVFQKKKYMTIKNMAHESVHIASVIFLECGIDMGFTDGLDEHYAYLIGWAASCCEKVKKGKVDNLIINNNEKNRS